MTTIKKTERQTIAPGDVGSVSEVLGGEATEGAPQAAAASTAANVAAAPTLTPEQWAKKLGQFTAAKKYVPQSSNFFSPRHAAADALYGWSQHAYHYQDKPFLITQDDYAKALDAAGKHPTVAPHAPAIPPSQADRFKDFTPRASRKGNS